jgi:hypothetical protein
VLARRQRDLRGLIAILRRHAQRHGLDFRHGRQHRFDRREAGQTSHRVVTAGRCHQLIVGICRNGGQVLVVDDLADADDRKFYC